MPLVALVAALASVRPPEEPGFLILARPHTLPAEVRLFPHRLAKLAAATVEVRRRARCVAPHERS
jgi:hypothetical protein